MPIYHYCEPSFSVPKRVILKEFCLSLWPVIAELSPKITNKNEQME